MTSLYLWLKWAHIVSSTVLFGTGAGIAFFFVRAQRTADPRIIAAVASEVVLADSPPEPRCPRCRERTASAGSLPRVLPALVFARLARLHGSIGNLLSDDRKA
jgi:hypothetical protein